MSRSMPPPREEQAAILPLAKAQEICTRLVTRPEEAVQIVVATYASYSEADTKSGFVKVLQALNNGIKCHEGREERQRARAALAAASELHAVAKGLDVRIIASTYPGFSSSVNVSPKSRGPSSNGSQPQTPSINPSEHTDDRPTPAATSSGQSNSLAQSSSLGGGGTAAERQGKDLRKRSFNATSSTSADSTCSQASLASPSNQTHGTILGARIKYEDRSDDPGGSPALCDTAVSETTRNDASQLPAKSAVGVIEPAQSFGGEDEEEMYGVEYPRSRFSRPLMARNQADGGAPIQSIESSASGLNEFQYERSQAVDRSKQDAPARAADSAEREQQDMEQAMSLSEITHNWEKTSRPRSAMTVLVEAVDNHHLSQSLASSQSFPNKRSRQYRQSTLDEYPADDPRPKRNRQSGTPLISGSPHPSCGNRLTGSLRFGSNFAAPSSEQSAMPSSPPALPRIASSRRHNGGGSASDGLRTASVGHHQAERRTDVRLASAPLPPLADPYPVQLEYLDTGVSRYEVDNEDTGSSSADEDDSVEGHTTEEDDEYVSGSDMEALEDESENEDGDGDYIPEMEHDSVQPVDLDPASAEGIATRKCAELLVRLYKGQIGRSKEDIAAHDREHQEEALADPDNPCHSIRHTYAPKKKMHGGKQDIFSDKWAAEAHEGLCYSRFPKPSTQPEQSAMQRHLRFAETCMDGNLFYEEGASIDWKGEEAEKDRKKRICLHKDHQANAPHKFSHDIDSVMGFPTSLAVVKNGTFVISFVNRISLRVKTDVHLKRVCQWKDDEGRMRSQKVMLKDIPHITLGQIDNAVPTIVHVFFPSFYTGRRRGRKGQKKFVNVSQSRLRRFYTAVVWPAMRVAVPNHDYQHMPPNYALARLNAQANAKEKFLNGVDKDGRPAPATTPAEESIQARYLEALDQEMRKNTKDGAGKDFEGYFLHLDTKNVKTIHSTDEGLLPMLQRFEEKWVSGYDMTYMGPRDFWVDVGMQILPKQAKQDGQGQDQPGFSYLWRKADLEHVRDTMQKEVFDGRAGKTTFFTPGLLNDAAEMTIVPPAKCAASLARWVYTQHYSQFSGILDAVKTYPFANPRILELSMDPATWLSQKAENKSARKLAPLYVMYENGKQRSMEGYRASVTTSFGVRMEHRIPWSMFLEIIEIESQGADEQRSSRPASRSTLPPEPQLPPQAPPIPRSGQPSSSASSLARPRAGTEIRLPSAEAATYYQLPRRRPLPDGPQLGSQPSRSQIRSSSAREGNSVGPGADGDRTPESDGNHAGRNGVGGSHTSDSDLASTLHSDNANNEVYSTSPHYVWALTTENMARFYAGNFDKLTRLIERGIRWSNRPGISRERGQVVWMLLHTLMCFANCHLQRNPALVDDHGKRNNINRLGMGMSHTMEKYGFGWFLSRIDWRDFVFKPGVAPGFAGINSTIPAMLRAHYRAREENRMDDIDMYAGYLKPGVPIKVMREVLVLMCHACMLEFRDNIRRQLKEAGDFPPHLCHPWPTEDDMPFSWRGVSLASEKPVRLVSGNKSVWCDATSMFEYFWTDRKAQSGPNGKAYNRRAWDQLPFRQFYRRCKGHIREKNLPLLAEFKSTFYFLFFTHHWVMPYPHPLGTILHCAKSKVDERGHKMSDRVYISFLPVGGGQWAWGKQDALPGQPPAVPKPVHWSRQEKRDYLNALIFKHKLDTAGIRN